MATRPGTIDWLVEQGGGPLAISARKMFGEYALYQDGKLVALVCDDRLFVKPTPAGRAFFPKAEDVPPYPGAKPSLAVPGEWWDDRDWLAELFRITAEALPAPKPKKARRA